MEESAVAEVAVNTQKNNNNISDYEAEEAAIAHLDPDEGSLSRCGNDVNEAPVNNNGMQASSTAAGIPGIGEMPGSCQPCQVMPEEQMELGETLHFENRTVAMHNGNPGESPHASILFPQTSGKILCPSEEELKDSSSGDSSSDSESDTSSSSSSSSSSSTSLFSVLRVEEEEPLENETPLKTKDELLLEELPAVEELSINLPADVEIKPFGRISSIIDQLVIVESLHDIPALNEDTVVFNENRLAVGKIFEIFGPVPHPFYVIRFNSKDHLESTKVEIKNTMYIAPSVQDFTQYIIPDELKREKGSDASWTNDQEPPAEALDYSDDEKEKQAKQKKKSQNPGKKKQKAEKDKSSMSSQESNQSYGGQKFSRPYARNGSAPRFSNGRGSHMQQNTFRQHQDPYFQPQFQGQHMMHQSYPYHSNSPQDYSLTYANNGHQPPPPNFYGQYPNIQHFPAPPFPPPQMIWPEQNMHFSYMQNFHQPPPPPPPPPPHPNQGDPNYPNMNHS